MMFQVGDIVRYSGHVTMKKRDYWNQQGSEPAKSNAKRELDRVVALRGTVVEILPKTNTASAGLRVQWSDGTESQCLSYVVIKA
jgi:hypothetical protein